jgi:D-arabinose 1-dehydrogenase-like Zn-dependent alcohol dehydrogenase
LFMKSQQMVAHGAPLQEFEAATPTPRAGQVIVKISHCGVCHSDLHLFDGHFELGNGKQLSVEKSAEKLPFTLGHEIVGTVAAVGAGVSAVAVGDKRVIYPWIGCNNCPTCARGDEHLCGRPAALGVSVDGGYSDYVIVPDQKYLIDFEGVDEALACTYACSGLTAYSALQRVLPIADGDDILVVGAGGLGMMAIQMIKAMTGLSPLVADIDDDKLAAAMAAGAKKTYNTAHPQALRELKTDTNGGAYAALDFVGADCSFTFGNGALRKGGKQVIVGMIGGAMSMPLPLIPMRAITIAGGYVGSLEEMKAMMVLVRAGKIAPIPIDVRPMKEAYQSLEDLRNGKVTGRVVLENGS